jgi:hypothetical protein
VIGTTRTPPDLPGIDWAATAILTEGRLEKLVPFAALGIPHVYGGGALTCLGFAVPPQANVILVEDHYGE